MPPLKKSLPDTNKIADLSVRRFLDAVKINLETMAGQRGDYWDQMFSLSEAKRIGLVDRERELLYSKATTTSTTTSATSVSTVPVSIWQRWTLDARNGLAQGTHELTCEDDNSNNFIPKATWIVRAFYYVQDTFVSGTDAATIALGLPTDDPTGLVAAIAISHASNPWDVGEHEAIPDHTVANFTTRTTDTRQISATVNVEDLTDGRLQLFVQYVG